MYKKKKNNEDIVNYRLEKINKIIKKPNRKGFQRFFDDKNNSINASNIENGSMSSKIFNKSGNKKNVTLRMLDFEENNYPNQFGIQQNEEMNSRIRYLSFLIYIIVFLIYKNSLFSCDKLSLNNCVEQYTIKVIIYCFIKCVISGFILSANICLIFWRLLSVFHIFLLLIMMIILLLLDYGNNMYNHGLINFTVLFISLIFGFLFFIIFQIIVTSIRAKNYKNAAFLICTITFVFGIFYFLFLMSINCSYWNKGLQNTSIDNNKDKYSCRINSPSKCYMNSFDSFFDFSSFMDYNCETVNKPLFREIIDNYNLYYDREFDENVTVLNFPLTNTGNYSGEEYNYENNFAKKVINNIKGDTKKDTLNSEVFLVKNENDINIEMNINRNEKVVEKRKKLLDYSYKIRNILFIYFDSLSRAHFHRKLRTFSSILTDIFDNSHTNYESFEFFKYHTFNNYFHQNPHIMFYGTDTFLNHYENEEEKPLHILSHLKQKGYITAQSSNKCSKLLSTSSFLSFEDEFDHENIAMFCDPNYFLTNHNNLNIKGIHSSFKRCIYGKDSYDHVINYGKLFWDAYPENNKFLRLGFYDGNERTGEVVKYLDNSLSNFVVDLINQGKFSKTALFLVSGKGELEVGIFNRVQKSEFHFEKNLGSWFILINKYGIEDEIIQNLRNNLQTFVTPYDIYDTMLSLIYNCYDLNCHEKIKHKSKKGNSVFNSINAFERNCEKYSEIKDTDCHCTKY